MTTFASDIIEWQRRYGRHDLPWQKRDPYAVWISEIMLQQTQVTTVIPYYERFMHRFPDVAALAQASLDEVLAHWSGLGYYSRARNLHRAARLMIERHDGNFPSSFDEVVALPGIGRSTAAAIMVFGFGERHAILDGNVKRVLARLGAIGGYPGQKRVADALWKGAERLLPDYAIEAYTQGLMDLGAGICVRSNPRCSDCPVRRHCIAFATDRVTNFPAPRPRRALPHKRWGMMIIEHGGAVLLEKRPAPGVWGGLWCFPELEPRDDAAALCMSRYGVRVESVEPMHAVEHGFTHFTLTISPVRMRATRIVPHAGESDYRWIDVAHVKHNAIPAPVRRIIDAMSIAHPPQTA